jgi:hypothetical protein
LDGTDERAGDDDATDDDATDQELPQVINITTYAPS